LNDKPIIIGARFAGLAAGVYAQMNGYRTRIYEMHSQPGDRTAYDEKKDQVARTVVTLLDQRFAGISEQLEMVDVATPLTWERYTGNWQGSFEGWLITPQNASVMMQPMRQNLPGMQNFYMCGQWVEPGGGLPSGVTSGRRLIRALCKEDGLAFRTSAVP
jgi:phytoene dehydrogenase-like protein